MVKMINGVKANHLRAVKLTCFCLYCLLACLFGASVIALSNRPSIARPSFGDEDNCVRCHTQLKGRESEVVKLHAASAHGRVAVGCNDCHGGDPAQAEKARAHSTNFIGKPDRGATLVMCGACHQPQLAQFKTSKHFPEKQGIPRLDCAECHGAHSIGDQPETFSLGQYCAGCHGLEYLPALPQQFQDLLNQSDELRDSFKQLTMKGDKPSGEAVKEQRELRRLRAEIIHPTDLKGGLTRIPQILSQGEKLKERIKGGDGK